MPFIQESAMLTALPLIAAGLAVVAWRKVMVPMARLLELSEDLAGLQQIPRPVKRRATAAQATNQALVA